MTRTRSLLLSVCAIAMTAAAAVASAACGALDFVISMVASPATGEAPAAPKPVDAAPVRWLQAKAFMRRLVKRERPIYTGIWLLCPSV